MPRKSDNLAINNPKLDRRVKLSDEDRENIQKEYTQGDISIRALGRKYKVDKRLIQFILFPERQEKSKKDYQERRKDGRYYDKEKHREAIQKHRLHKKDLYQSGLLEDEKLERSE